MGWGTAAIVGGTILSGVLSSNSSKSSANKAADATKEAADASARVQWDMYNQQRQDFMPFHDAGVNALSTLKNTNLELPDEFSFNLDPNDKIYKWKQDQAAESVNRAMAARGLWDSRAAVNTLADTSMAITADEADAQRNRALQEYGLDYSRATDLYNSKYNNALNLANIGSGAAGQMTQAGSNTANALANIYQAQGESAGNAALARGYADSSLYQSLGNAGVNALSAYYMTQPANASAYSKYQGSPYNAMVV
jgi:hypothetical protein